MGVERSEEVRPKFGELVDSGSWGYRWSRRHLCFIRISKTFWQHRIDPRFRLEVGPAPHNPEPARVPGLGMGGPLYFPVHWWDVEGILDACSALRMVADLVRTRAQPVITRYISVQVDGHGELLGADTILPID